MSPTALGDSRQGDGAEARTEFAWSRSGLAMLGALAVLGRQVWHDDDRDRQLLTVAMVALGALGWALGVLFSRRSRPASSPLGRLSRPARLLLVVVATVALAVAGLVASLVTA